MEMTLDCIRPGKKAVVTEVNTDAALKRRLKDFVDAIRKVTEFYSIPVLDLYATSGLQPQVPVIMEKFCPDGLHPNDAGQEKIYKRLRAFLESL